MGPTVFPFVGESPEVDALLGVEGAGISSHSAPDISSFLRKNGHNLMSIVMDSFASAVEIGTGEDLTTAVMTSFKGRALRLREGVEEPPPAGLEKSLEFRAVGNLDHLRSCSTHIQILSAMPARRPNKHLRLMAS